MRDLVNRYAHGRAQQSEHQRNGRRSGHAQRIEDVEQNHIHEHDGQEQHHHLGEREHFGVEHPAAGYFHHTAGGDRPDDDTYRGNRHDDIARSDLRTQSRVKEVHRIVGHSDHQPGNGQGHHDPHDDHVHTIHKVSNICCFAGKNITICRTIKP